MYDVMLDELDDERGTVTEDAVEDVDKVDDVDALDDVDELVVVDIDAADDLERKPTSCWRSPSRRANRGRTIRCACI